MCFISCCKWAYLSWHHWHCMCLITRSLLTNHSLRLAVYSPWLPWGHIKPEASLENTFWGLGLTAWSHWCTCQKHAATSHTNYWLPCNSSAFLEPNYHAEVLVGPVRSRLNSPETHEHSKMIRLLFFPPLSAFCQKDRLCSAMDWHWLQVLPAEDSHW